MSKTNTDGTYTVHFIRRLADRTEHLEEVVAGPSAPAAERAFREARAGQDITVKLVTDDAVMSAAPHALGSLAALFGTDPAAFRVAFAKLERT